MIKCPEGFVRKLSAQECREQAAHYKMLYNECADPSMKKWLRREYKEWLRLADERA